MKKEKDIKGTTFTMNVNGVQYTVWNGTWIEDGVCVRNDETQAYVKVRGAGRYSSKSSVRTAILKNIDELSVSRVEETTEQEIVEEQEVMSEDEAATLSEYGVEMMNEQEDSRELFYYGMRLRGFSIGCQPKGVIERADDTTGKYHDIIAYDHKLTAEEIEHYDLDEIAPTDEQEISEEEIVQTINDWIYRSLPKYVQKAIDYCDYVDGVYRIHVKTEHGSKEIAERRWVDASANVRQFVKNAK